MADETLTAYRAAHPGSAELFNRQLAVVPGGTTHRSRHRTPFPLFIAETAGARKRTVDGAWLIDYWMGHGALIFGHADRATVEAVSDASTRGFHAGGETEAGVTWAERICELVPSAEQVRFTSTGGEATQLAVRLARVATGRELVVQFRHGFHGWSDQFAFASGVDTTRPPGVPRGLRETVRVLDYNDLGQVRRFVGAVGGVAAIILEPAGAFNDTVPVDPTFLEGLRDLADATGTILIFDEVVTGFRYSPGGAQQHFGVTPDITTLGKIVSGGLPAGAVAGHSRLLRPLAEPGAGHIPHSGTWNANPVTAAAGCATLGRIDEEVTARMNRAAERLRAGFRDVMRRYEIDGAAYGRSSIVKLFFRSPPGTLHEDHARPAHDADTLMAGTPGFDQAFERAMVLEGVDWKGTTGFVSAAHGPEEVVATVDAFERALARTVAAVGRPGAGALSDGAE